VGAREPDRAPPPGTAGDDASRTAGSYNNEGLVELDEGRPAEARAAFERALARDPKNASALANLSDLVAQGSGVGDRERADALLLQSLAAGLPDAVERILARVGAERRAGAAERGLALLDRSIAALPARPDLHLARGRLRLERQDCRGALGDFEAAASARSPGEALAWGSAALARLCLGDRAGAVRALERSLALDPHQPEIARTLAQLQQARD
jgi:Tfp pilus assembly protein PilF